MAVPVLALDEVSENRLYNSCETKERNQIYCTDACTMQTLVDSGTRAGAGAGDGTETLSPGHLMDDLRLNLFRSPVFAKYLQMCVFNRLQTSSMILSVNL